jgi:hypothetical protein
MVAKPHELDRKPNDMMAARYKIATRYVFQHPPFPECIGQPPIAERAESGIGDRCDARHIVNGHDGCPQSARTE